MERLLKLEHIMGIEVRELMSFIDETGVDEFYR